PFLPASRERVDILIVDDTAAQRMAVESVLAELGENVVVVDSGLEALRHLLDHDVAVILLDVNMPEMDGFETAAMIRQRPRTRNVPIIFLTADTDELHAARGYSLGAVDYLFSPFLPDILRTKVKVFVELARMHAQMRRHADQPPRPAAHQTRPAAARRAPPPGGAPGRCPPGKPPAPPPRPPISASGSSPKPRACSRGRSK